MRAEIRSETRADLEGAIAPHVPMGLWHRPWRAGQFYATAVEILRATFHFTCVMSLVRGDLINAFQFVHTLAHILSLWLAVSTFSSTAAVPSIARSAGSGSPPFLRYLLSVKTGFSFSEWASAKIASRVSSLWPFVSGKVK